MSKRRVIVLLGALAMASAYPQLARAHPHVLVDATESVIFNAAGEATAVASSWSFDDAFSAYAVQGYDSKGDGLPTRDDLQPLAETNMKSLERYHYFTRLTLDGKPVALGSPTNYWDEFIDERMVLHFTLPLAQPLSIAHHTLSLQVYDPDYFAAVTLAPVQPSSFAGEPSGCTGVIQRPEALDASAAARLAQIPVTQRELPPELRSLTNTLVNAVTLRCR